MLWDVEITFIIAVSRWYRTADRNEGNTLQTAALQPHGGIALYKDTVMNTLSSAKITNSSEISKRNGESFNGDVSFSLKQQLKVGLQKEKPAILLQLA